MITTYQYDNLHRMKRAVQSYAHDETSVDRRVDFTYDLAGQFKTIARYASTTTASPVAVSEYSYDFAGRLTEIEHRAGATPGSGDLLAGYGYQWNQRSQLTSVDFLPDGVNSDFDYSDEDVTYDYDDRHQLEGADYAGLADESYAYDENGNRTSGGFTVGANNRLLSDGTYNYQYDNEGNRVLRTKISDGSYTEYAWDHRNRLVAATDFDDEEEEISRVEYRYDADNQLVGRKLFLEGSGTASESTVFIFHNGQVVLQLDGAGNDDLTYEDLSHRYLWGPVVDMLLADEQIDWTDTYADGEVLWALGDHLGSVRDVVDNSATVRKHASYDAFGNVVDQQHYDTEGDPVASSHAEAVDVVFGYTGKLFDEATGLQNNLNRWYDPATGRWTSEDPIWVGSNKYAYVGNKPTTHVDRDGLKEDDPGFGGWGGGFKRPRRSGPSFMNKRSTDEQLPEPNQRIDHSGPLGVLHGNEGNSERAHSVGEGVRGTAARLFQAWGRSRLQRSWREVKRSLAGSYRAARKPSTPSPSSRPSYPGTNG